MKKILLNGLAYPAFFLVWLVLGAYWTFPYDRLRDYIVQQAEAQGGVQLDIASLRPSWLTGVSLEGVRVTPIPDAPGAPVAPLSIRELDARISLLSLLGGTIEVSYDATIDGGGTIEGVYAESDESTHVEATLQNVDLRRLGPLHETIGLPVAGRARGTIDMTIASEAAGTQGTVDLTIANVSIGDGETPLVIEGMGAGVTLERLELGTVRFKLETERGQASIEQLGADGEHAQLWGSGSMRLVRPLRMSSLDLLLRIKFKDAYRESSPRMTALFSLLEMNPQVRPARTSDGALQWRIQGAFASRIRMVPSGRAPMPEAER